MDEFGVLTARYGLKPQGKSAPMAALKQNHKESPSPNSNSGYNSNSMNWSLSNDHDTLFGSSKNENLGGDFDVFGGFPTNSNPSSNGSAFDYDSIFSNSYNSKTNGSFGDDIFGSFSSNSKQNVEIDELLGGSGNKSRTTNWNGSSSVDDLISGFGSSSVSGNGRNTGATNPDLMSTGDPFDIFESASTRSKLVSTDPLEEMFSQSGSAKSASSSNPSILKPPPKAGQVLKSEQGPAVRRDRQGATGSKYKEAEDARRQKTQNRSDDLESFFTASPRSSSVPKSRSAAMDSVSNGKTKPEVAQRKTSKNSTASVKKVSPTVDLMGDFSSIFGDVSSLGEFEDVEGESEERRRARLGRHQRTNERVAKAVADMNDRDRQTMLENEEKSRIAETMDAQIKRWLAGKEGNMRALLSTLQYVLWPECGWEPVSLTDLITSTSVKKVYRKATLCVHPDKVQQKGATVQQKYIAEKVFDILKEAWNKFSKEELK